ncbi:hypothetical protein B0J11DRAFT_526755 [Dendryphion nanum]|uniref:FHA domain-containing protein n=1 Tax=Dendryphion nanum TaxID=256645 RepID=A0A9P9DUP0_9PLEO|nr:hypothetical protein B0J11DRAFT_526755 [Dendryphion nanum]
MWFLQHEFLFEGKRVWLRPGSQQLFGRTAKSGNGEEGKHIVISHKAVSRQHMMIKVYEVPPTDGTKLHSRSPIEITDLSCRQGTVVDDKKRLLSKKGGDSIAEYDTFRLTGTEHTIQLVASYPAFKIKWEPMVITFATKSKDNALRSNLLHALDIKTSMEFIHGQTTHVVSQKRNLPKVLQGLVAGKFIVTSDFLDKVIDVATPQDSQLETYKASKLEEDFDLAWPQEKEYVPPVGAEPVPRDARLLEPDVTRSEVFAGLTFVFLDENQHSSLQEPLAGGTGKVLLYDLRPGQTTVDEYVDYVRSVMGRKRGTKASAGRIPVITIRLPSFPEGMEEWAANFRSGVDLLLNQRSVPQNEILDAIIMKDATALQKPPSESELNSSAPETKTAELGRRELSQPPESQSVLQDEPVQVIPRKRPIRRGVTVSRFTGFDDFEPPPKARKMEPDTQMEGAEDPYSTRRSTVSEPQPMALAQRSQRGQSPAMQTIEEIDKEQQMEALFPAAAEMKRRRAATRAVSASVEPETQLAPRKKTKTEQIEELQAKARRQEKANHIDVREAARKRVKEEDERREAEEENLREQLQDIDIAEIAKKIEIGEMQMRPRQNGASKRSTADDREWQDEWNGRKNFKKFRRRGAENAPRRERVIVALEEASSNQGYGVGDPFYLEEDPETTRKTEERRHKRKQEEERSESEQEPGFTRRKRTKKQPEVINVDDSGSDDNVVVPATYGSGSTTRTQRVPETQAAETQTQRGSRKRGAASVAAGPSKKTRYGRRDDDSDDEETGFRLKKRR